MKKKIYAVLAFLFLAAVGGYYYVVFPAISIHETGFWGTVLVICLVLSIGFALQSLRGMTGSGGVHLSDIKGMPALAKVFLALAVLVVVLFIGGSLAGSTIFRARAYASLLPVKNYEFSEDIEETDKVTDIALMDTESARKFGNRKIGSLSEVVSQYEVESDYTQISIQGHPMKVSGLKYASFFKWWNNKSHGVPGYVKVNPVNSEAEYVALDKGMKYIPSAYFNYNLQRHVQFAYPTKIISGYHFEIDDEGNPFYICPTMKPRVGLFGGMDVNGAIICDPVDGKCEYYPVDEIPAWVDSVYDGDLLTQKYDWFGTLSGGFINSVIGQKGCKITTDDYGYKIIGDDVWAYTGVTSVNGDQSNIGFVLMNQRTSEAKYYKVSGAEEHSAMESAQGAVQEKRYKASFPSLINVSGQPTYIMVLKDSGGLVKMYAMVNVEQYNIVATATSQTEVFSKYRKMLASSGEVESDEKDWKEKTVTVESVQFVDTEDGTMVYVKDTEHGIYKQAFKDNEELIRISAGDVLVIYYEQLTEDENEIHQIQKFEFSDEETPMPSAEPGA